MNIWFRFIFFYLPTTKSHWFECQWKREYDNPRIIHFFNNGKVNWQIKTWNKNQCSVLSSLRTNTLFELTKQTHALKRQNETKIEFITVVANSTNKSATILNYNIQLDDSCDVAHSAQHQKMLMRWGRQTGIRFNRLIICIVFVVSFAILYVLKKFPVND